MSTVQMNGEMAQGQAAVPHERGAYHVPSGSLRLSGPVARPAPGELPLRGDLAHIALAQRYLVQNYVCPIPRVVGGVDVPLLLHPHDEAEAVMEIAAGSFVELLDVVGPWGWICKGPDGPAGFVRLAALT